MAIFRKWLGGKTKSDLARMYGLTRQRINAIVQDRVKTILTNPNSFEKRFVAALKERMRVITRDDTWKGDDLL